MATFASTPATVAYDTSATQPLGALSTGMGYDPTTPTSTTVTNSYIGGQIETIGFGQGVLTSEPPQAVGGK